MRQTSYLDRFGQLFFTHHIMSSPKMSQKRNKNLTTQVRPAPFDDSSEVHLDHPTVSGALPFLNPTTARFNVSSPKEGEATTQAIPGAEVRWRSRDNRKGRHVLAIHPSRKKHIRPTSSPSAVLAGIGRMFTTCPYWDVSYLVAVFFTVGCLIFIVCGLFAWLPIAFPKTAFSGEADVGSGWTSAVGATLFQIGAILLVLEACNENRTGCFGWALEHAFSNDKSHLHAKGDIDSCQHHHSRGKKREKLAQPQDGRSWQWLPTWHELRTHYIFEIGWLASITLAIGATVFYVCGIMALPYIYSHLSLGVIQGVYYLTYLVGGVLFVISSALYMLEVQPNWYTPAPKLLGWHIGLWNMIGSVGWTLAASFGYCQASWCEYQSELTLVWASAAFTIGSALLWYEAVNKYTVEVDRNLPAESGMDESSV